MLSLLVLAAGPSCHTTHLETACELVHGNVRLLCCRGAVASSKAQLATVHCCAEHSPGACDPGTYEGPSVAAVINWANTVGIDNQHFTNDSGQAIRGLVAKHDIPPKTTLVSMHRSMAPSMITGQNSPFPDLVPNDVWRSCGECVFTVHLAYETKSGLGCCC